MMVTTPPLAPIFDSHAHYDDAAFDADRDTLLAALPAQGVCGVINAATDPASARRCIALARRYPYIRAAVGIHPECAAQAQPGWVTEIVALIEADRRHRQRLHLRHRGDRAGLPLSRRRTAGGAAGSIPAAAGAGQ